MTDDDTLQLICERDPDDALTIPQPPAGAP